MALTGHGETVSAGPTGARPLQHSGQAVSDRALDMKKEISEMGATRSGGFPRHEQSKKCPGVGMQLAASGVKAGARQRQCWERPPAHGPRLGGHRGLQEQNRVQKGGKGPVLPSTPQCLVWSLESWDQIPALCNF